MINRKLIILSGAGDPENEKYKKVYYIISKFAKAINYNEIVIHGWKGQDSNSRKGLLNMTEATNSALLLFKKHEESEVGYDVICRSFGTGVFLNVCQKLELKIIGFATLWGMPSYTNMYKIFKEDIVETIESSKNKGVNLDNTFFDSIIPFDLLLDRFEQKFRINIVNGTNDIYSPVAFYNFLMESFKNKNITFSLIDGLPHEVTEYHQVYLDKLFNKQVEL